MGHMHSVLSPQLQVLACLSVHSHQLLPLPRWTVLDCHLQGQLGPRKALLGIPISIILLGLILHLLFCDL